MDHYLKPIIEHRNLIVAVTALTALVAVAASIVFPPSYQSTASVLLTPISGNPLTPLESDTDVDMATELLISTSKAVVGRVADDLGAESIGLDTDELADNISAASPRDSKVLDLTYRATTPELAQTVANSFATNYLEYREQIAAENRAEAVELLNERIALLKEQLARIEGQLSQLESGTQSSVSLSVERDSVDGELRAQQDALAALSTLTLSAGEVLSPARLPVAPTGPGLIALVAGGLSGGLVIGVTGAMLLSAVQASRAPRNRRASDHIEHNRRREDRFQIAGRRATDRTAESVVEKLARVTADREQIDDGNDGRVDADEPTLEATVDSPEEDADKTYDVTDETTDDVTDQTIDDTTKATIADAADGPTTIEAEPPIAGTSESIVHEGDPPAPPMPKRFDRRRSGAASTLHEEHTVTRNHEAPAPDPAPALGPHVAAHFGDDVPPPPRNKAKLRRDSGSPSTRATVDRRSTVMAGSPRPSALTSSLEVETDLGRLVDEISSHLATGPLACLAVGQNNRAQAVAAGFALVDGLKDLDTDVLIIDATLDQPVLADLLGLSDIPGLSELIVGKASMEATIQQLEGFTGLYAVTTGKPTPLARSAFDSPQLSDLLGRVKQRFPLTVIIGGDLADAAILSQTDGELDGLVIATTAPPGEPADSALVESLSTLNAPAWVRISVAGGAGSTSTAATAQTIV